MSMFTPEEQAQLIDLSRRFTQNLMKLVNTRRKIYDSQHRRANRLPCNPTKAKMPDHQLAMRAVLLYNGEQKIETGLSQLPHKQPGAETQRDAYIQERQPCRTEFVEANT